MEIKNVTTYSYDALMALSGNQAASPEGKKNHWFFLAAGILNTVSLIRYGLHLLMGNRSPLYCLVFAGLVLVELGFFIIPLTPRIHAGKMAKQNMTVAYIFDENGLTHSRRNGEITSLSYADILEVTESPDYYFLDVAEAEALIVAKNGFTEGTEPDFRVLLKAVIDNQKLHIQ